MSRRTKEGRIVLTNVRLSFPSLFEHELYNNEDTGKFTATFLIPKSDVTTKKIIDDAINELMTANKIKNLPSDKLCIKDGDEREYDGYEGNWSIKASTKKPVMLYDRKKQPIQTDNGEFYAGCYVNASISLWYQDNGWGKRINASLYAVQFVRDGEPFGENIDTSDDFETYEEEETEDDMF